MFCFERTAWWGYGGKGRAAKTHQWLALSRTDALAVYNSPHFERPASLLSSNAITGTHGCLDEYYYYTAVYGLIPNKDSDSDLIAALKAPNECIMYVYWDTYTLDEQLYVETGNTSFSNHEFIDTNVCTLLAIKNLPHVLFARKFRTLSHVVQMPNGTYVTIHEALQKLGVLP